MEDWAQGDFELPEYFHHGSTDSHKDDLPDVYTEYGIYEMPGLCSLTENPLYLRTNPSLPPEQRRLQFKLK